MELPKKMRLIVAGNVLQFHHWCQRNKISPKDLFVRYVSSLKDIQGRRNCEVIYYGEYWKNPVFGRPELDEVTK